MKTSKRNWAHNVVDKIVLYTIEPFATAQSREQYGTRGYILFGIMMLSLLAAFSRLAVLRGPASNFPWLNTLFVLIGKAAGVDLPAGLSILTIIGILYTCVYFVKPIRHRVGIAIANAAVSIVEGALAVGEWCLAHRLTSFGLAVALITTMASMTTLVIDRARDEAATRRDAERWIQAASEFVSESTLSETDYEAYGRLPEWRSEFSTALSSNRDHWHPALILHLLFANIFEAHEGMSLPRHMYEKRQILDSLASLPQMAVNELNAKERHASTLVLALRARLLVRESDSCSGSCPAIQQAQEAFRQLGDTVLRGARANGEGTIYARAVSRALNGDVAGARKLCDGLVECADKALRAYNLAAIGKSRCSFEGRRRENNITDLLNRIGYRFDKLALTSSQPIRDPEWRSEKALAARIAGQIQHLMSCAGEGRLLIPVYVTTAQAYATRAKLLQRSNQNAASDMRNAGMFLRLAYSFDRADLTSWNLEYFCIALHPTMNAPFVEGLATGLAGLPSPDWALLQSQIAGSCS